MWRFAALLMLLLNVALVVLYSKWGETTLTVLAVNDVLMDGLTQPHPVHDAQLTAWYEHDGSITVIVNGQFRHRILHPCAGQSGEI